MFPSSSERRTLRLLPILSPKWKRLYTPLALPLPPCLIRCVWVCFLDCVCKEVFKGYFTSHLYSQVYSPGSLPSPDCLLLPQEEAQAVALRAAQAVARRGRHGGDGVLGVHHGAHLTWGRRESPGETEAE